MENENEEELLRSVALQNARAILLARERAEKALLESRREIEQKNLELSAQREWFKVALASIGDAVITTDTFGAVTFLNPIAEEMTGWKLDEARGRPLAEIFVLVHEQTRAPVDNPVSRVLREGIIVALANHTVLISKNGSSVPIEDSAAPIRDANGTIIGVVLVFHNVTARRARDEALRRSEQFSRSIIDATQDSVEVLDLEGRTVFVSENAQRQRLPSSAATTQNIPWAKSWDGPFQEAAATAVREAVGGQEQGFIATTTTVTGETKWWDVCVGPIRGEEGRPDSLLAVSRDVTKNKSAEEQSRRLAAVIESSDDAILSMTLEAVITTWNRGAQKMYGYSAEEVVGKSVKLLIPPDRVDEEPEILERLKRGERIDHYETVRRTKAGVDIHVSLTVSPIVDAEGRIIGVSKTARDITQRKRDEEALRRSEEDLRALANTIPQMAWMARPDGYRFWYNRRWFDYTGATPEEVEGWGWQAFHDPAILPEVKERFSEATRTGTPLSMEFPLRGADGKFRWFLTLVNPLRDGEGRVVRWFGTNTDIDDVRRAQLALTEERSILELLNDTGTAIASNLNLQTLVQTVTDAGVRLSGAKFGAFFYNVIDAAGESYLLYTLSGAPRSAFEKFGMPRNTPVFNPTFMGEGVVRSPDITKDPRYGTMAPHHGMPKGHLPVCSYLAVPVISRSGKVLGGLFFGHPEPNVFSALSEKLIVGIAAQASVAIDNAHLYEAAQRELAQRKEAERALLEAQGHVRQYAEDLEKQVAKRTRELREKIEELEAFSYSVSHDLRAPLRAIQSFSLILGEECAPRLRDEEREYLRRISTAAQRMDRLIQDVLAYSRVSRRESHMSSVDLGRIIDEVIESYPLLQAPSAIIEIHKPLPKVQAEEAILSQCVSNILSNAVKFVAPGTIPHVVIWPETMADGTVIRLFFKDNGLGIPPEAHERIFGMFERITNDFEGTGIGLSIVKKGIERMGGKVGLTSALGEGSTFWLDLKADTTTTQ